MIVTGGRIHAEKALKTGLLDKVFTNNLLQESITFAASIAGENIEKRRLSRQPVKSEYQSELYSQWRTSMSRRKRGVTAPQACIDAVAAASILPFDAGMRKERELFLSLRQSYQAKALQHIFFAERRSGRASKIDNIKSIESVAIIGAGTMGTGIAMALASSGLTVTLLEKSDEALDRGITRIQATYAEGVTRGKLNQATMYSNISRIKPATEIEELSGVDMVVEAVFENLEVKQKVFTRLDNICKPDAILATNTSYLDVNEIAKVVKQPENVIGMHFFSPANIMKLVEVVKADRTSDKTLASVLKLLKPMGKTGVVSGVCHGFIGNRMYQSYQREAGLMLLEGASPAQIDKALYEFGMPMGVFVVGDMSGLDIGYMMRQSLSPELYEAKAFTVHNRLVESERKGQKTGAGFYKYEEGSKKPVQDESVISLIEDVAAEYGIERRAISASEIIDRCMLALVNEGARILDEGIASSAADIDVVYTNGYGFPRHLGGPMHWAASCGLNQTLNRVNELAETFGSRWWTPADSLKKAAQEESWQ